MQVLPMQLVRLISAVRSESFANMFNANITSAGEKAPGSLPRFIFVNADLLWNAELRRVCVRFVLSSATFLKS
jgi:hypothetical protein